MADTEITALQAMRDAMCAGAHAEQRVAQAEAALVIAHTEMKASIKEHRECERAIAEATNRLRRVYGMAGPTSTT